MTDSSRGGSGGVAVLSGSSTVELRATASPSAVRRQVVAEEDDPIVFIEGSAQNCDWVRVSFCNARTVDAGVGTLRAVIEMP
jgi:hypothetical protein